jgi:hypothetical protein
MDQTLSPLIRGSRFIPTSNPTARAVGYILPPAVTGYYLPPAHAGSYLPPAVAGWTMRLPRRAHPDPTPRRARYEPDFGSTTSLPRIMLMPHVHVNSPARSGVNSTGVVLKAGNSRAMWKSPKITRSLHESVSSR